MSEFSSSIQGQKSTMQTTKTVSSKVPKLNLYNHINIQQTLKLSDSAYIQKCLNEDFVFAKSAERRKSSENGNIYKIEKD